MFKRKFKITNDEREAGSVEDISVFVITEYVKV